MHSIWSRLETSPITHLPFSNDSDHCYGKFVQEYKDELKSIEVITEVKHGLNFVNTCLRFPSDPSSITHEIVFSLLKCIRLLLKHCQSHGEDFTKELSKPWLRTNAGYRPPDKCLLFNSKWSSFLKPTNGPFIDETFMDLTLPCTVKKLNAIGVISDVEKGCSLVASHLDLHYESSTIARIYRYLNEYDWKPENDAMKKIWIPKGVDNGEWVNPEECVNHDKDDLYGSRLHVLKNYYDKKLLPFFDSAAFT